MRHRPFLPIIVSIAILASVTACKKEQDAPQETPPENTTEEENEYDKESFELTYKLGDKSVQVEDEVALTISDNDGKTFSMPYTNISDKAYNEGDLLVIPDCEAFPGGYTAKITSVAYQGGKRKYTYEQVAIDDVFENLHYSQTGLDLTPYVKEITGPDGTKVPFTKVTGGFEISIPELFGGINSLGIDIGPNLSVSPSMKIGFKLAMDLDIVDFSVTYARVRADVGAKLGCDITIKNSKSQTWMTPFFSIDCVPIVYPPLVITPRIFVAFVFKITGEVNMVVSFNYEKSYYAMALYDGEVHTKAGEVGSSNPSNPFNISWNFSGAVEAGPNVGVTVSLYRGALGFGIDFDPHFEITSTMSVPMSGEYLANLGNSGYVLSNFCYEPALAFKFGGFMELAYKWMKRIDVPDNVALKYSFGKTYVMPQNCKTVSVSTKDNVLTMETYLKNKSIFGDNMHITLRNQKDKTDAIKIPFEFDGSLDKVDPGDSVRCSLKYPMDKLKGYWYKIEGPYIDVDAFGTTYELSPGPSLPSFNREVFVMNSSVEQAVRGILTNLYAARSGEWEGCNWADPNAGLSTMKGVTFTYYDDAEIAQGRSDYHYYVKITPDASWKFSNLVHVTNHTGNLSKDSIRWVLKMNETEDLTIDDVNFLMFTDPPVIGKSLSIHSPLFDTYPSFYVHENNTGITVDFSGCGIKKMYNTARILETDTQTQLGGTFIFDGCPINDCHIGQNLYGMNTILPKKLSFKNCPSFSEGTITIYNTEDITPITGWEGSSFQELIVRSTNNEKTHPQNSTLNLDCKKLPFKKLTMGLSRDECADMSLTVTNNSDLAVLYTGRKVERLSVSGCPALTSVESYNLIGLNISSCPSLTTVYCSTGDGGGKWSGRLEDVSISGASALKNLTICSSKLNGIAPDYIDTCYKNGGSASYPYKYSYTNNNGTYELLQTNSNGFYYSGEPDRPYDHINHKYYQ